MTLKCVVHQHLTSYSKIRPATAVNKDRIAAAKSVRESFTGSNKHHAEQCEGVPESYDDDKHGVYHECYKRYNSAGRYIVIYIQ